MLVDRWKNAHKHTEPSEKDRYTPTNIQSWHNYSAYGDIVCHDSTLKDDFFVPLKRIRTYCSEELRDYVKLYNPYKNTKANKLNRTGFLGDLIAWEDGVYGTSKSVFSGSARTCRPDGRGAPGGPRLRVGGAAVGGAEARLHGGDAAEVGAAGAA